MTIIMIIDFVLHGKMSAPTPLKKLDIKFVWPFLSLYSIARIFVHVLNNCTILDLFQKFIFFQTPNKIPYYGKNEIHKLNQAKLSNFNLNCSLTFFNTSNWYQFNQKRPKFKKLNHEECYIPCLKDFFFGTPCKSFCW